MKLGNPTFHFFKANNNIHGIPYSTFSFVIIFYSKQAFRPISCMWYSWSLKATKRIHHYYGDLKSDIILVMILLPLEIT